MFRITAPNGETFLTEKVEFIRQHAPGVFLRTERNRADGVSYGGSIYLFAEGAHVCEFDAANELRRLNDENAALEEQLAESDAVALAMYEEQAEQETVIAEHDEAILGIYEMIGG